MNGLLAFIVISEVQVSVALVTRNRPASLERCLSSWRAQSVQPFEIIVSDDSDSDQTDAVKRVAVEFGCVYITGPRRGLAANRNCAAQRCRGSHMLSADDDQTYPVEYLAGILEMIPEDPRRVWILPERPPGQPDRRIGCPAELHRSGFGLRPRDPSNCAAIADGSTVYPREIFDQGLRFDETYPFGGLHYLWGKWLVKNGWRISYSDKSFLWHHGETENRATNLPSLQLQLEAATYVSFANALWLDCSASMFSWAILHLARRMITKTSIKGFQIKTRVAPSRAVNALANAIRARDLYRRSEPDLHTGRVSILPQ